jgi:hypothetical protein
MINWNDIAIVVDSVFVIVGSISKKVYIFYSFVRCRSIVVNVFDAISDGSNILFSGGKFVIN